MIKIVKITKQEADFLRKSKKSAFVKSANICHKSKAKTYYAVEEDFILSMLAWFRKQNLVEKDGKLVKKNWNGGGNGKYSKTNKRK